MFVSVVIPLYNKSAYIGRAIDSVLLQIHADLELIVVDDGSTDDSGAVVGRYRDSRVRLITQANAGEGAARNRGIREARGSLLAFVDGDDEWLPEHLLTMRRLAERHPDCGLYATALNGRNYPNLPAAPWEGVIPNYFKAALGTWPVTSSTAAVWRRVFDDVGMFVEGERMGTDIDMWCRIAFKYRVAFSTARTAVYHCAGDRVTVVERAKPPSFHRPVLKTLEAYLRDRQICNRFTRKDLRDYRLKCLYEEIIGPNLLRGNKLRAAALLARNWPTRYHLRTFLVLTAMAVLPRPVFLKWHEMRKARR